uniref:Uncoupling protein 3 n=1 Tax=Ornithorhynchus anatinus TaxID=9258 RepID=F6PWX7_ORNAN
MVGFKPPDAPPTTTVKFFGAGTAACFADILTFPLDTAKVRLQIQGEPGAGQPVRYRGVLGTILTMARTEGPGSLYGGLVAGLQRQMSFASVRIGLYDSVKQLYTPAGSEQSSIAVRLLAGCTTGAMAVTCAQPTDVVKVRFQACVQLEPGSRKYSGTVDAYRTIAREEGVRGLWKGRVRFQLHLLLFGVQALGGDDFPCHFVSAFGAGFCATVVASPVDVVKTRYMNSAPGQYPGVFGCMKAVAGEGPAAFYKGFTPSFLRLGSWNVVMFVTYEQLKRALMEVRVSWESPF